MKRVLSFAQSRYEIEVEAGIEWPELISYMCETQRGGACQAAIVQKQTGADKLSIGGALAANIHGRGLNLRPFVDDVESFVLVNAEGERLTCSRSENQELFRLVIGGKDLFGVGLRGYSLSRHKYFCFSQVLSYVAPLVSSTT